ncbi:MAG: EpsI family protein [Psychromonas sp.]|nr:EpsI family protein [Alteromonadales bacterium]MCP5078945.1 EpsI family protein [Psychromonas sp.]
MKENYKALHIAFIVGFAVILLSNASILITIFTEWNSNGPYSHGFLGGAVVLYALWLKRVCFADAKHSPSMIASFMLLMSCLGLLINHLASIQQLQQLMLFAVICFYIASVYGFGMIKKLFFPLIMLALIFPVWNVLQTPLRELSTVAGDLGPSLVGVDVLRDDYRLSTYGGIFDVDPACSGLGFFMVSALFAACVSCFNNLKLKKSLQFLLICLCFAVFANWLRIITIIVVGSYTHMQHFIVQDHLTFGWVVFAFCLVPLIYLSRHYFDGNSDINLGKTSKHGIDTEINKVQLFVTYSILLIFSSSLFWIPSRFDEHYSFQMPSLGEYNLVSENKSSSPNWSPISFGVSDENFNFFIKDEVVVQVYLGNYIKQSQAHEMIYVENSLFDEKRWSETDQGKLQLESNKVNLITLTRGQDRSRLIAYWYLVNGKHTASKKLAKLEEVKSAIAGTPGATLIAFAIDYRTQGAGEAHQQMQAFTQTFFNNL